MEESPPLILCLENTSGEEVALKIEPNDTFQTFLEKAKLLLGYDVDLNAITCNQTVSLDENAYTFLLNAEQSYPDANLNPPNFENDTNDSDDLVYVLDDGTQIRASQIQFDNEDPLTDLTAENIPFVKYNDSSDDNDTNDTEIRTIKDIKIVESPVSKKNFSPKGSFVNSLPFKLVCNNISNFEAQFTKYLESSAKTFTNSSNTNKVNDDVYKNDKSLQGRNSFYTREEILDMFKDSPVTPLPCEEIYETRKHVRKTDPSRLVYKGLNAKPVVDIDSALNKHDCFICGKNIESGEKLYLFDKEDQMLHRCEQRKFMTQLKIICEKCLGENFKPSRMKSPSQSLDNDEYLVIKNNQQYIFQKISSINLNAAYDLDKDIETRTKEEFVNVEIGEDGEIITKLVDVKDVTIIKDEKKDSSSDVEIVEPEAEIDIDNIEDENVKEFLGKYQCDDVEDKELKCRFCNREFNELYEIQDHVEEHKLDAEDGTIYPCPLCDYGYANSKWLKGHLRVAHENRRKKPDDKEENQDKSSTAHNSPVAKRTRGCHGNEDVDSGEKENLKTEDDANDSVEPRTFTTEVKQEYLESSDDSIWIVQTGEDDVTEEIEKFLKGKDDEKNYENLKKHKCFTCSKIFPSSETLISHKCRKRKQKSIKDESVICVPSEEDFLKRARGRLRPVEDSGDNDLLIVRGRKKKNREQSESQIVTCHNCNESFTSKVRLKFHMQFHESPSPLTAEGEYACAECAGATFGTETQLFDHVHFQHDKQKRWQCPVAGCGKTFFLRATLTKHSRTHTDTRRYVCVTCGKRFLDKQTLDEHSVTHLQIKPFQCHVCLKQLTRRSRLRMHLRAHEEELAPALVRACAACRRAFADARGAQDHANKSTECIEEFTKELKEETEAIEQLSPTSGIVRHAVRANDYPRLTKGIEREVKNAQSEELLAGLDDAAMNIIRVVNIEKAFRCEYCEDVFYIEGALNKHRTIHKGIKNPFTCHICKVSFATYSRCTTHKTTHGFYKRNATEVSEGGSGPASAGILGYGGFPVVKHFLCEDCGRSYLHWTYLQVHRRMKHANENYIFKCNHCDMTFPNSWSMTYHRKKVHGKCGQDDSGGFTKIVRENYRIPCRDCDAVLPNKNELYRHRNKEHCEEPLTGNDDDRRSTVCGQCGHNLHNATALQKHIKELHAGAHPCDVCGLAFTSRPAAARHRRHAHAARRAPALLVLEIEGTTCSTEEITQHLNQNNIAQDKVIEITMITFKKDTTNIVPKSPRSLSLLGDVPKTRVAREKLPERSDIFQTLQQSRNQDVTKMCQETIQPLDCQNFTTNIDADGRSISNLNVQLLLQDGVSVNDGEMMQLQLDNRSFLG